MSRHLTKICCSSLIYIVSNVTSDWCEVSWILTFDIHSLCLITDASYGGLMNVLQFGASLLTKRLYPFWSFFCIFIIKKRQPKVEFVSLSWRKTQKTKGATRKYFLFIYKELFRQTAQSQDVTSPWCISYCQCSLIKPPTRRKSTLWHRKAQTGTCRGAPSDSDGASELQDGVPTKMYTCGERSLSLSTRHFITALKYKYIYILTYLPAEGRL